MGVRATIVAHLAVTCGVRESGRGFQYDQTWLCKLVDGKCYRPATDWIVE